MRRPDSTGLIELLELAESRVDPARSRDPGSNGSGSSPTPTAPPELPRKSNDASLDRRLIKALGHPVRVRALEVLNARVASPSELARVLSEPLGNVAYHVKILEENDAIELVRTAPVRGALEHFYRAKFNAHITRDWLELDKQGYDEIAQLVESTIARVREIEEQSASRLAGKSPKDAARHPAALVIMHVHDGDTVEAVRRDGAGAGG
jgi:DNA-binding transcriptional ArsR family regulator